jgi:signal transduction histidine kinase
VSNSLQTTNDGWWLSLRPRLTLIYIVVALVLLTLSGLGQLRLLDQVGKVFGGFFWAIDTDGRVVVVSTPSQQPSMTIQSDSANNTIRIIAANHHQGGNGLAQAYAKAHDGDPITYTILQNTSAQSTITRPATIFTLDMWWQNYGLALLAGLCWLLVGGILLATAQDWSGAVEGITLLPPSMLLLLDSHWGNVQRADPADIVFQLLWVPSFALLGAAFIHLSLTYRPEALVKQRRPKMRIDMLPYLPLLALLAFEWITYLVLGHVPTRANLLLSLGYAAIGGVISLIVGLQSILRLANILPLRHAGGQVEPIPARVKHRLGDLLTLWIGGVTLGFCLSVLPILFTGQTLLPLPMFYLLAAVYPLLLWYAIRSLRLVDTLHVALEQKDDALQQLQSTTTKLRLSNSELQRATSLLLHADAHLRSLLSQRIHDQPKQQALRIRSLLAHWQHKLQVETEQDGSGKVAVQPVIELLGKVRKISEELEEDLRGLQLLVEDAYQRRSLGLRMHLEKLMREDLPMLHPESPLRVQADLWALDVLNPRLEQSEAGAKVAEAISYTVTQALLNIYNHAGSNFAAVRTLCANNMLEVSVVDDGRGFDINGVPPEKTSLFKAQLKAREAGGRLTITSAPRNQPEHGTTITLCIPLPRNAAIVNAEFIAKPPPTQEQHDTHVSS